LIGTGTRDGAHRTDMSNTLEYIPLLRLVLWTQRSQKIASAFWGLSGGGLWRTMFWRL
jgi:hypothetical protein